MNLKLRLTILSFLQFFVWGAWLITMANFWFGTKHWEGTQFGAVFGTMGIASIFMPTITGNVINGQIVYVDNYENIFTNIHRSIFDKARQKASHFTLYIGSGYSRYEGLKISNDFKKVADSDIVVFFVNDYMVIAIKHGDAAGLLGGSEGEILAIEFSKTSR